MTEIEKTEWTCDGGCGARVQVEGPPGDIPQGWFKVEFSYTVVSTKDGVPRWASDEKILHAYEPCVRTWIARQQEAIQLADGAPQ